MSPQAPPPTATPTPPPIIIIGAGPVGLLLALRLAQSHIPVIILEAHPTLLPTTRAMVYMPVVIPVLQKLGIFDEVVAQAYCNHKGVVWRDLKGNVLGKLSLGGDDSGDEVGVNGKLGKLSLGGGVNGNDGNDGVNGADGHHLVNGSANALEPSTSSFSGVLLCPQAKMAEIILAELRKYDCVEVRFGLRCVGIDDSSEREGVRVMVHDPKHGSAGRDMDTVIEARYVIGCDGANSAVRRMLCIPFEGFTYNEWTLVGCDVISDLEKEMGWTPLNFVVDPEHFCVIAYTGQDEGGLPPGSGSPQWRFAYPESRDLEMSPAGVKSRAHERVSKFLKEGVPFRIIRAEPYVLHQRVAKAAFKGRVFLAGDALHSNNPMGGLGLTSGILDAYAYGNAFTRVVKNGEAHSLLTECANSRRQVWIESTDKMSQGNLQRMYGFDKETIASREGFFKKLDTDATFHNVVKAGFDKLLPDSFE